MISNYATALAAVLKHEGGYVNHPSDPGGATMRGVTQAVYDAYRRRLGLGVRSVKFIADDELQSIYRKQYWDMVKGDELPSGVDYAVFDFAVNSGPHRAAKYLQTVLGVKPDGIVGQITIQAAEDFDPVVAIKGLCDRRMVFLRALPTWPTFGRGWSARVAGVRALATDMAVRGAPPVIVPAPKSSAPRKSLLALIIEFIASFFNQKG